MIRPFGEAALLVEVASPEGAQALAAALLADPHDAVRAVVPGLRSVLVELDPGLEDHEEVEGWLRGHMDGAGGAPPAGRERTIPVAYGGAFGPDLPDVAAACGMPEGEVVRRHSAASLRVQLLGFAPGFAYIGDLPEPIRLPRLETPRTRVPAGSVGIAGALTGIYPAELPGGWRIIGRTPVTLFDPRREPPSYLAPGDTVRFRPMDPGAWPADGSVAPDDW